jgi:hypothetical protein
MSSQTFRSPAVRNRALTAGGRLDKQGFFADAGGWTASAENQEAVGRIVDKPWSTIERMLQ